MRVTRTSWRIVLLSLVLGSILTLVPAVSFAQGIAGQVSDETGGRLPGVTVEASSPALIEGSRIAVTDGQGLYQVTELSSGAYTVTFTLPGFGTVVREGLELATGFTATVDISMSVGTVAESITVSGESPIVDVQTVSTQNVFSRETQDVIPTGRSAEVLGRLMPGTSGGSRNPDVGGSSGMQRQTLIYRGDVDVALLKDGFRFYLRTFIGASGDYVNNAMLEEIQYITSGDSADGAGGIMKINHVPKDGGNTFSGSVFGDFTTEAWTWDNVGQDLIDRGVSAPPKILRIYDFNPSMGGPIVRDKLWFHGSFRNWGVDRAATGSVSEQDPNVRGKDGGFINSLGLRLTWQISPNHKLSNQYTTAPKYRSGWGIDSDTAVSPEAAAIRDEPFTYNTQTKWTATLSNSLLVQAGVGLYASQWTTWYRDGGVTGPGQERRAFPVTGALYDPWYPNRDQGTGHRVGVYTSGHVRNYTELNDYIGSIAYVTGSHSFKAGFDIATMGGGSSSWDGEDGRSRGSDYGPGGRRGDWEIRWRNGQPNAVLLRATPRFDTDSEVETALYAQNAWTTDRLTINTGIRFEHVTGQVPELLSNAGTWVPARLTPAIDNIPKWTEVSPRLGVSWDMFGTAETALKFTVGRYASPSQPSRLTRNISPMRAIVGTTTVRWLGDFNDNLIPDTDEMGPIGNEFFGTVQPRSEFDPDVIEGFGVWPHFWDYAVTLQHQVLPTMGVTVSTYYRKYANQTAVDNRSIGPGVFDEFSVVSPDDPLLPGGGGQTITGLYVIEDASRPLSDPFTTHATNFGDHSETYRGVELSTNWRASNGGMVQGGVDWGERRLNACYVIDSPQLRFCERPIEASSRSRGGINIKGLASVPLPYDWFVSGTLQSTRGPEILADWRTRTADGTIQFVDPSRTSLGDTPNVTVQLIEPGTEYDQRYWQVDLRGTRIIALGGTTRLRVNVDLYNALNAASIMRRNNRYGSTWGQPSRVLEGRLFKVGAQLDF